MHSLRPLPSSEAPSFGRPDRCWEGTRSLTHGVWKFRIDSSGIWYRIMTQWIFRCLRSLGHYCHWTTISFSILFNDDAGSTDHIASLGRRRWATDSRTWGRAPLWAGTEEYHGTSQSGVFVSRPRFETSNSWRRYSPHYFARFFASQGLRPV